jgi:RNA polymerase sigma factor for flagellar operon FliA
MDAGLETAVNAYRRVCQSDLRDQLIIEHLPYVRHILGRMLTTLPDYVDNDNLESAGTLGLVEAAGQFDPSRGVAFTTFAYQRIRGAILDELRRNCPVPQQMLQNWALIREKSTTLPLPLTSESLAEATGLTVGEIEDCLAAMRLTRPESWADELGNIPGNSRAADAAEEKALQREQREILADAIEQLKPQHRIAVTLYYMENLRMKEIGEVMNISESRVSRLLAAAELKLQTIVRRLIRD